MLWLLKIIIFVLTKLKMISVALKRFLASMLSECEEQVGACTLGRGELVVNHHFGILPSETC